MKRILLIAGSVLALLASYTPALSAQAFSQVTNGPANATGVCTSKPGIYYDQANSIIAKCGSANTLRTDQTALGVFNAQTALSNVTTAQTLFSLTPATVNLLNVPGRTLQICFAGIYTTPGTTTPTLTLQVVLGGVTPLAITTGALSATASTNMPFNACFWLVIASTGSSGTVESHGSANVNISANTPAAAVASYNDTNTAVSSAINLTNITSIATQVAASSTVTSVQLRYATIELVN